ncbi:MAG: hypothetical protein IJV22_04500 [Bacteroidales bacterium]|nr:hypothetical protein [Bacteroidales bacterium]
MKHTYRPRLWCVVAVVAAILQLASCGTLWETYGVNYQSVRKLYAYPENDQATIKVETILDKEGNFSVRVTNLSNEVMTIDRTKSFVVNTDGASTPYYDPTIHVESTASSTGTINGFTTGAYYGQYSTTWVTVNSTTESYSTVIQEQPQINIPPHCTVELPKSVTILKIQENSLNRLLAAEYTEHDFEHSDKFSLYISYSVDGGKTCRQFEQSYYINAAFGVPVVEYGRVNAALRKVLTTKTDCVNEPWWAIYIHSSTQAEHVLGNSSLSIDKQ